MTDPRDAEPRDEAAGEIRLNLGGEDDSVTQEESAVREESTAAPEFEFDPADSQIVEDLEPREIAGVMADGRMPDDMRLGEVSVSEEGLSLPVDVDRPVNEPAPLEATAEASSQRWKPSWISAGRRPRLTRRSSGSRC